jgi:hypothetical protein
MAGKRALPANLKNDTAIFKLIIQIKTLKDGKHRP